jgi:hypothetical protein
MTSGGVANAAGPVANEHAAASANGGVGNGIGNGNSKHEVVVESAPVVETAAPAESSSAADHSDGTAGTSGEVTEPQPPSGADQNPGGANGDQCSTAPKATYCSTRDGSPSENGNGGGEAKGKPCAGCVGKADNKNPPGQEKNDPRGTFPNNGYECDNNHGIGKGNPAHTGCQGTTPPPCDDAVEDCDGGEGECDATVEDCDGGEGECDATVDDCDGGEGECDATVEDCDGGEGECDATVEDCDGNEGECDATVEDCDGGNEPDCIPTEANNFCSEVEGNQHHNNGNPPDVLGEKTVRTPQALPFTGDSTSLLLGIAGLMVALGGGLTLIGRRPGRVTV